MNPKVDACLKKTRKWRKEMEMLRKIALDCGLTEELKWGKPCYSIEGGNVVIIQGFKEFCALLFCKGALLRDPKGILQKPGENTQAARRVPFTDAREISRTAPILKSLLHEAIKVERAGLEVNFKKNPEPVPAELQAKFEKMPAFKAAFAALTPGRQRAYILHFSGAKQSQTRESRIEKCLPQILKGKGLNDYSPKAPSRSKSVKLLSGGNPQIAKGDGDAPVQAFIAAMPGWKSELGRRLDALIVRHVPGVRKAVKWNTPFYGIEGQGWFLGFHVFTHFVKVTFLRGISLRPIPPGGTPKSGESRWIDLHEGELDQDQMAHWVKQAAALPGWIP